MSAVGQLLINQGDRQVFTFHLLENGVVTHEISGGRFTFQLMRAPVPSEHDIRQMSSVRIAQRLAERLREEDNEREQSALEARFYEE